jgi:thymidylate synthase
MEKMPSVLDPQMFQARDLPEAWFICIRALLLGQGSWVYQIDKSSSGNIRRLEFDYVTVHVVHPENQPYAPDVPQGVPAPTTQTYIDQYYDYLVNPQKKEGEHYTYGEYLGDQIPFVIEHYQKYGYKLNHCHMVVGDKDSIKLYRAKDGTSPCLRGIDTRVKNNKLHFMVYFRSWDLWAGFPTNLGGINKVQRDIAELIGVEPGEMIVASKGLHLYDYCWEYAVLKAGLKREDCVLLKDLAW